MRVVLRFPIDSQCRLHRATGVDCCQPIQYQPAGQTIGPRPRIAFNLHVECAAIMRTRSAQGRDRDHEHEEANCKAP
jgi:hypothetical protein